MMKHWFLGAIVVGLTATMVVTDADAKRLGGSKSSGVQRQTPSQPVQKAPQQPDPAAPQATPNPGAAAGAAGAAAVPAAAAAAKAGAPAAAQAAKRSWTGPLMGLAAGLGLAALFSHLGMGEAFSSIMMMLLLAMVGFVLFRFIASRFGKRGATGGAGAVGGLAAAGASAAGGSTGFERRSLDAAPNSSPSTSGTSGITIGSALQPAAAGGHQLATADERRLPADFDTQAFERAAKTIFIRLQAANDARNLDDLRAFSTPEMFAELKADLLDRGDRAQHTDVISVNPTIVDFADEGKQRVVSVRYVGVIREEAGANAESFDEVWHLVQNDDSPAWRIAGIQQNG